MSKWPTDFPRDRRAKILSQERYRFRHEVTWQREDEGEGNVLWWGHTPYSETVFIARDADHTFSAMYQVNGTFEDPVLDEVELGTFPTYHKALLALSDHVSDLWGSYVAWEERIMDQMAQEQEEE